ncbi:hypothetical protein KUTeg_009609 [Tegillarca granosa]|uniref:RRM domain-containing protein n=1 Tax=Tegillarca granosa TaxID=220873 RepID=A0ABQ9F7Q5_TEGGR|nr:hypothetical protein KUTeg_009609 [Tegillarca granosa]
MSRDNRIYCGNLPPDIRARDIEDLFYKYGRISFVDLKTRRGPPFAFVEFEDPRDAQDAVKDRDGYNYDGYTLRVEFPRGGGPGRGGGGGGGGYHNRYDGPGGRGAMRGGMRGGPPSRRSEYRVLVSVRKLDDSKFRSHEGEVSYVRVKEDYRGGGGGGGRSRSRSRSYSPPRRQQRGSPRYSPMRSRISFKWCKPCLRYKLNSAE